MKKTMQLILAILITSTFSFSAYAECLLGDVSGNGKVSGLDAAYVFSYLSGKMVLNECQRISADTDGDGKITRGDALLIGEYTVQNLKSLPAQFGDVLYDGAASAKSATAVMQYIQGSRAFTDAQKHLADVNGDGTIDGTDANLILQYSAKVIPKLPIPR